MLILKSANYEDIEKEWLFQCDIPVDENGFINDYHGISRKDFGTAIETMIAQSKGEKLPEGYVPQTVYYLWNDDNIVGFTREGQSPSQGLAVLLSDGPGGKKRMYVGGAHASQVFVDKLGKCPEEVTIDADGNGEFRTEGGSVSVWIPKRTRGTM